MRTRAHVLMQYKALHACAHACAVISLAQFLVMADWSVDKPLDEPRTLFVKDGVYHMDTEVGGLRILCSCCAHSELKSLVNNHCDDTYFVCQSKANKTKQCHEPMNP